MRRLVALLAGGLLAFPPAVYASRCNQLSVVTDASGGSETRSDLLDLPVRVCSVEFIANGANGFVLAYDSPDDTLGHAQMTETAEAGAAVSGDSAYRWYGEDGRPTRFGLDLEVFNGTAIVSWTGSAP